MSRILVTGGAGYIGSHTCVELLNEGHDLVVVDNLVNSSVESLKRVRDITGRDFEFVKLDVCDKNALNEVFDNYKIDAVIHFAGLKAVGESVAMPLDTIGIILTVLWYYVRLWPRIMSIDWFSVRRRLYTVCRKQYR
jgi:UDP-glucose 4-epimerase